MKRLRLTTILVAGSISGCLGVAAQTEAGTDGLTEDQSRLFDELIERERQRAPEAARVVEENPEEAAALFEAETAATAEASQPSRSPIVGTFLQPWNGHATKSVEDWVASLRILQDAGIGKVIVQWTAFGDIAYFQPAPEWFTESHPLVNRLLEAAARTGTEIVLGLSNDPDYWRRIETRDDVLDVYLRVRNTRNLRLQEALLDAFDGYSEWTGYYLSEEIDDLNWREPGREEIFRQFLLRSGSLIRENDDARTISVSSFFRKRTAPSVYANNLLDLVRDTDLDRLWIQDGIGVELLASALIEPYYLALRRTFQTGEPEPGVIVELFEQTSAEGEPFAAQTALPARVERQLKDASSAADRLVVFSIFDYADPRAGERQKEVYDVVREWNRAAGRAVREDAGESPGESSAGAEPGAQPLSADKK